MKLIPVLAAGLLLNLISSGLADQKPGLPNKQIPTGLGEWNSWDGGETIPVLLTLTGCLSSEPGSFTCGFNMKLNRDNDGDFRFLKNHFFAVFNDGTSSYASKLSVNAGAPTGNDIKMAVYPKIDYKLTVKFENVASTVKSIKYLDVGPKRGDWLRYENLALTGMPATPLPSPQATLNPKQYLTLNAQSGYGTLSGVALNGGMYDVNLLGCRVVDGGTAACTLTLAPMRATPQAVTLEDLNVTVNGQSVQASATATPAMTTLTVTAPVNVNRVDELRLGNARFLNVGIR